MAGTRPIDCSDKKVIATPFARLSPQQVRRRWFPKLKVTILAPVKLSFDPELKGKARRQAAGAALYEIMSDLVFRTTSTDRTVTEAITASMTVRSIDVVRKTRSDMIS